MHAKCSALLTPLAPVWGQKVNIFFSEEVYGAHHIMQLKCFTFFRVSLYKPM